MMKHLSCPSLQHAVICLIFLSKEARNLDTSGTTLFILPYGKEKVHLVPRTKRFEASVPNVATGMTHAKRVGIGSAILVG